MMRTLAVIPARGGSKRLSGKNIRPLNGKPLIQWSIDFASSVDWFSLIEVSTDSADISQCCREAGLFIERLRPTALATDEASSVDAVLDVVSWKESKGECFDLIALLQPTTPIRQKRHWDDALALLENPAIDAVVGVGPSANHPYLTFKLNAHGHLEPWLKERPHSLRSQDLEPAVNVNGALYLVRTEVLKKARTFFPPSTAAVLMDDVLSNIDIDTEFDWLIAEQAIEFSKHRKF